MVDDVTDEPKSVTSGRESQHRRSWRSAGAVSTEAAGVWDRLKRTQTPAASVLTRPALRQRRQC